MAEFQTALKIGQEYEKIVLSQIKRKYPRSEILAGYNKKGDIYIPEIKKYIEVKSDLKSNFTHNIVVEVAFNGKPSALSTTESWYWVFIDGEYMAWIFPNLIWKCIIENKLKAVKFIGKGDTKSKIAYLVPRRLLYNYADKVVTYKQ